MTADVRPDLARCDAHGLVADADGSCVICRRAQTERDAAEARTLLRKLFAGFGAVVAVLVVAMLAIGAHRAWVNRQVAANAAPAPGAGPTAATPVVVYGTAWCGACRSARAYLTQRNIPFQDIDIDRDHAAFLEVVTAAHFPPGSVPIPILHVGTEYHKGWDRAWFDSAYAENTASNAL